MAQTSDKRRPTPTVQVFFDDEVVEQIFAVIRDAKKWLYLVSPYNEHRDDLREHVRNAINRGVKVTVLHRADNRQDTRFGNLDKLGATIVPIGWLHAKIYISESAAVATSMNLLETSFENGREFGILLEKGRGPSGRPYRQLVEYVHSLQPGAMERNPRAEGGGRAKGFCIRCRGRIRFDAVRPLCDPDLLEWAVKADFDYPEVFCHRCGRERETSRSQPLCANCLPKEARTVPPR